jgi:hypothetical protein
MRIAGPRAAEQADHRSIEDMFRRMHRRILLLVMGVENGLFHIAKFTKCEFSHFPELRQAFANIAIRG